MSNYKILDLYDNNIVLLSGVPASGKSFYGKILKQHGERNGKTVKLISRDEIRFRILDQYDLNNENYFSKEDEVFDSFVKEINAAIEDFTDLIIIDATHINAASRNKILNKIKCSRDFLSPYSLSIVYFNMLPDVCNTRNQARSWKYRVPESAMKRMIIQSSKPALKQLSEEIKNKFTNIVCYEIYNTNHINHVNLLEGTFGGKNYDK